MPTIINNPTPQKDSGGMGFLIGIIIFIFFLGILIFYGIPAFQNRGPIEVNLPETQINMPAPEVNVEAPASTE